MARRARRLSTVVGAVALVAAVGAAGAWVARHDGQPAAAAGRSARATDQHVIASPTSVAEPPPGTPVATDADPVTTPPGAATSVVTTYSGWDDQDGGLEVDGFVPGLVESAGTCTLRATQGARTVTVDAPAQADASTMQCGALVIPADELGPGAWRAVLSYRSDSASGQAPAVTVEVPVR